MALHGQEGPPRRPLGSGRRDPGGRPGSPQLPGAWDAAGGSNAGPREGGAAAPLLGPGLHQPGFGGRSSGRRVPGVACGRVPGSGHSGFAGGGRRDCRCAMAPWRRAAGLAPRGEVEQAPGGPAEPMPEGHSADSSPAAEAPAAGSYVDSEESSRDSEQVDYLVALAAAESRARRKGDSERVDQCVALAAGERRRRAAAGLAAGPEGPLDAADAAGPRVGYAASLSSEPSTEGVGSTPSSPRSPIVSPATPEAYYESLERLEICSIELQDSNQDGGATSSSRGAAKGNGRASGSSRTGARPAAAGRGRPPGLGSAPLGRPTGVGVDTRLLGKPHDSDGKIDDWRDWSVVFEGYAAAAVPG